MRSEQVSQIVIDTAAVTRVQLSGRETRNALSASAMQELAAAIRSASADPACRCLVVESAEPGMFCSGFRLGRGAAEELRSGSASQAAEKLYEALYNCPVPTLAAIDGPARGGGVELALRCDLRIASERATFAIPALRHGLPYKAAGIRQLARTASASQAAWLLLTGSTLDAAGALRAGLIQHVAGDLSAAVEEVTSRLAAASRPLLAYTVAAVRDRGDLDSLYRAVLESEEYAQALGRIARR